MEIAHMFNQATESGESTYFGHMGGSFPIFFGGVMVLGWITWILVIVVLVLLIKWLWKKGL